MTGIRRWITWHREVFGEMAPVLWLESLVFAKQALIKSFAGKAVPK